MLARAAHLEVVRGLFRTFPVVGLLGARQVGKTTLARQVAEAMGGATHFDLEDPEALARLESPKLALAPLRGLVVLDEIQRRPELFPVLRVLADRPDAPARFLVLGSASPRLLRQSSESLAGRIAYHELGGFDLEEAGTEALIRLWVRGGFPRAFLAGSDAESDRWRGELVRSYLERDLPQLGFRLSPETLRRFWTMLAHYHGQTWNGAELARALGTSQSTVRSYLDVLCGMFLVRRLSPWHVNLGQRVVKAPKIYLSDSGILHRLLGIQSEDALRGHPKAGASWEGFAIEQVVRRLRVDPADCYCWAVHTGAALDLLVAPGTLRLGFEVKLTDAPRITRSMRSAIDLLELERLDVIHAGSETFQLADRIRAVALRRIDRDLEPPGGTDAAATS
jgi:predicted AAA+ superfamily ATPase